MTDEEIQRLITTPKVVTTPRARAKEQKKSLRTTYQVEEVDGHGIFEVYTRQNLIDPEAFSCGLLYAPPTADRIHLLRYNGSYHPHRNPLEGGESLEYVCHIHRATQRYIEAGRKAEHYAEATDRYTTLAGALRCLVLDCNVSGLKTEPEDGAEPDPQFPLDW